MNAAFVPNCILDTVEAFLDTCPDLNEGVGDAQHTPGPMTVDALMRLAADNDSAAVNVLDMLDADLNMSTDPDFLQAMYDASQS
jgi:hypothetical protein